MTKTTIHEQQFFSALREIFVGVEAEGNSGFNNTFHIKYSYYYDGVFLQQ